jgi:hypothetical protein
MKKPILSNCEVCNGMPNCPVCSPYINDDDYIVYDSDFDSDIDSEDDDFINNLF